MSASATQGGHNKIVIREVTQLSLDCFTHTHSYCCNRLYIAYCIVHTSVAALTNMLHMDFMFTQKVFVLYSYRRKSGWNSGRDAEEDREGLVGAEEWGSPGRVWEVTIWPLSMVWEVTIWPLPEKKRIFRFKWRVLVNSKRYFFETLRTISISVPHSKFIWGDSSLCPLRG